MLSDEVDAMIVEQRTETLPGETTTPPPTDTPDESETTMTDGQPGFGVAIAIVALLGAALLALRRRD